MAARRKGGRKTRGSAARTKPKQRAAKRAGRATRTQRAAKRSGSARKQTRRVAAVKPRARPTPAASPAPEAPAHVNSAAAAPPALPLVAGVPVAVGVVAHYFPRARAAVVALCGALSVGDTLHVRGATTDFVQRVASLRLDGAPVGSAAAPAKVGLSLAERAREGDVVYRVAF